MTGVEYFKNIKDNAHWTNDVEGSKAEGLYKKRADHSCFYAMLLPIPEYLSQLADLDYPSFIEIENLLPQDFLISNNFAQTKITTGNTEYLKIKDSKKSIIWKNILDQKPDDLSHFKQLYSTIYNLFGITSID